MVIDEEPNRSGSQFPITDRASIVQSDLGPESSGAFGDLEPNEGFGMRAESLSVFFSGDHHGAAAVRLSALDLIKGGAPIVSAEVEDSAVLHHDFRLDPTCPVVARIAVTGNDQVKIALIECDLDWNQAFLVATLQDPALVQGFRSHDLRLR